MRQLRAFSDPNNLLAASVFSDYVDAKSLGVATNESATVPAGANFVMIGASTDLYIKSGGTAASATDVADGTASMFIPGGTQRLLSLSGIATIGLISPAACLVTLEYYA